MARYQCPSCGEFYNGKRCRSCFYEHFTEEIAHGNHTHAGEPLVIDAPARKPIRRKNPFACKKKTGKHHPFAGFLVLLAIINALLPLLRDWGLELEAMEDRFLAETEPEIAIPEAGTVLYRDAEMEILTDWQDGQEFTGEIAIFIRNDSRQDLLVSARDVIVNNCMIGSASLYCEAPRGRTAVGYLRLDGDALAGAGIHTVEQIDFLLEGWEDDSYETVFTAGPHRLTTAQYGSGTDTPPEGTVIYADETATVTCLGYKADDYDPEVLHEGTILFHIENHTQRHLEIWTPAVSMNGVSTELYLWCQLYPGTRAISTMYLYDLEELGLTTADELSLELEFTDRDDYGFSVKSGAIVVDLG